MNAQATKPLDEVDKAILVDWFISILNRPSTHPVSGRICSTPRSASELVVIAERTQINELNDRDIPGIRVWFKAATPSKIEAATEAFDRTQA